MNNDKPETFVEALEAIIHYMDVADKYVSTFGPAADFEWASDREVQQDLEHLAQKLRAYPIIDSLLLKLMRG